jgi:YHS domain-containing protein
MEHLMKSATSCGVLALVLGSVLAFFGSVNAEDMPAPPKVDPPKTEPKPDYSKFANPHPGKCLVTDEDVDSDKVTADYKGKSYVFCCNGCKKKFVANPEKYLTADAKK